jgi:hypothetical protein
VREAIARIIDPSSWEAYDHAYSMQVGEFRRFADQVVKPSLATAAAVIASVAPAASPSEEDVLRERVAELEGIIAAVIEDVSERTKAGMSWGLHGHPTMSPKSLYLLTSRARSIGGRTNAE